MGAASISKTISVKLLANGHSRRANRYLTTAGIPIDKQVIVHALNTGQFYPSCWPPNYGNLAHYEVCNWAGVYAINVPYISRTQREGNPYLDNGLSYRAYRCLLRSAIPITKKAVRHALYTGALSPYMRPGNYGKVTHAEICRWAGVDESYPPDQPHSVFL